MEPGALDPFDASRGPEWRWVRAAGPPEPGDDAWVTLARSVRASAPAAEPVADAVRAAHQVWEGPPAARALLEARLLTAEPLDRVAERLGLPGSVVGAYGAVFFAVREARGATDWLLSRAVGYDPAEGRFTTPFPYAAWRYAALRGGAVLLDLVLAATLGPLRADARPAEVVRALYTRVWVASLGASTPVARARVARASELLRDLEARVTGPRGAPRPATATEVFLEALPALTRKRGRRGARDCGVGTRSSARPKPVRDPWAGTREDVRRAAAEIDALCGNLGRGVSADVRARRVR